jgi:hypothetical protein
LTFKHLYLHLDIIIMAVDSHTAAAIAQVVFYAPMVPTVIYVVVRNWNNRPRMAWYPMIMFSLREPVLVSLTRCCASIESDHIFL